MGHNRTSNVARWSRQQLKEIGRAKRRVRRTRTHATPSTSCQAHCMGRKGPRRSGHLERGRLHRLVSASTRRTVQQLRSPLKTTSRRVAALAGEVSSSTAIAAAAVGRPAIRVTRIALAMEGIVGYGCRVPSFDADRGAGGERCDCRRHAARGSATRRASLTTLRRACRLIRENHFEMLARARARDLKTIPDDIDARQRLTGRSSTVGLPTAKS